MFKQALHVLPVFLPAMTYDVFVSVAKFLGRLGVVEGVANN